jgi:tetratricopeptide (TPR) repeat protein
MKYCPNCGKAGVEAMKFCPQCGQRLMGSNLEEKQGAIPKPEAPLMESSTVRTAQHGLSPILRTHGTQTYIAKPEVLLKEQNWFERHLNWTMVLAWASSYLVVFIVALGDPYISEDTLWGIGVVIGLITSIAVGQWVLRKKNRSLAWLLICGTWFFLLIENHSIMRDEHGRTAADYDKLIELDPGNEDAYHERGDFYYEMDEYGKAIADYSRAIELEPRYASAYFNRAYAYGEIAEYDKAIADYSKAIELDPSDAQAYYNRGLDYQNKGEVPKAVSDLEKCIELSTDPELTKDARQALFEVKNSSGNGESKRR